MSCDMCGSVGHVNELNADYKTDDVGHVCDDCEKVLNKQLWKIRSFQNGVMKTMVKRYIQNKHNDLIKSKVAKESPQ